MEAQQEKLHFQLARIHEVNLHLQALMEATEHGLPTHMNLAIFPSSPSLSSPGGRGRRGHQASDSKEQDRVIEQLKGQNHLLTEVRRIIDMYIVEQSFCMWIV